MLSPFRRHRRFLRVSAVFVVSGSAFAMCVGVALGQVDVKFLDGPWKVTVVGGGSASASSARRIRPQTPDFVGTQILASDYDRDPFDDDVFVEDMRAAVQRQKEEAAAAEAASASASSATSRRSSFGSTRRSSVSASPKDEAERERIRQLFQDQPEEERPSFVRENSSEDEAERERVRALFQDQPGSSSARSSAIRELPEDEAERERVRRLFFDEGGAERPVNDSQLSSEDQAEQERIRRLFQDQPSSDSSAATARPSTFSTTRVRSTSACPRSRSLLAIFGARNVVCGEGIQTTGLINGDCPSSACILLPGGEEGLFGDSLFGGE